MGETLLHYSEPIELGTLRLKNRVFLAPLAGVSDVPFRRICQELGAGLTFVEMLSATAMTYGSKKTFEMMARHSSERVLGVQVTGQTAEIVEKAIQILDREGFDAIDINMGCPVKKIVNAGCGSAILKDPQRVTETLQRARSSTAKALSAKIRLGYTRDTVNVEDIAGRIAKSGCEMLTIHGRTRSESYGTPADLCAIRRGLQAAQKALGEHNAKNLVCVSNGDLFGPNDAWEHHRNTLSDAIMVSRGALGNPWIFKQILENTSQEPLLGEWAEVLLRHLRYHQEHYGNSRLAAVLMRKHLLWYTKGFPGAKQLREQLNTVDSIDQARHLVEHYFKSLPPDLIRYQPDHHSTQGDPRDDSKHAFGYDPKFEMDRVHDRGVGEEGLDSV